MALFSFFLLGVVLASTEPKFSSLNALQAPVDLATDIKTEAKLTAVTAASTITKLKVEIGHAKVSEVPKFQELKRKTHKRKTIAEKHEDVSKHLQDIAERVAQFSMLSITAENTTSKAVFCDASFPPEKQKKAVTALCLGIFFGGMFGADRFYYGYWVLGSVKLCMLLFICIGFCVGCCVAKKSPGAAVIFLAVFLGVGILGQFGWWIADLVWIGQYAIYPQQPGTCIIPM